MRQTYHITTYGCQMNKSDSERIASVLENSGFKKSSLEKANYAFLNLCSVRQSAIDRVWGKINNIKKITGSASSRQAKNIKIILTGCILPSEKNKFLKKVDYVLDLKDLFNWDILEKKLINKNYLTANPKFNSKFQAFVPIMTGCNNFCSYCAVPYTRDREKSRPVKDILDEVNKLIVQGYKFITLLGQNVNSYNGGIKFSELLKKINKIQGDYWLSFITSHPKDTSDELIKCFKTCKHLIPYIHLPIQSGSNKILSAMNRKYTTEDYLKLINKIKKINKNINLSTDIIVGFPNETEKDFNDTKKIIKKIKFDMAYIARYSPRPDTAAYKLKDNISLDEKKNREKILNNLLKKIALNNNKKLINKNIQVLIERKKDNYYFGKTRNFKNVRIKVIEKLKAPLSSRSIAGWLPETTSNEEIKGKNLIGKFINIKVTKANTWNLEGEMI